AERGVDLLVAVHDVGDPPSGALAVTAGPAEVLDAASTDCVTLLPGDSAHERWPAVEAFVDDAVSRALDRLTRSLARKTVGHAARRPECPGADREQRRSRAQGHRAPRGAPRSDRGVVGPRLAARAPPAGPADRHRAHGPVREGKATPPGSTRPGAGPGLTRDARRGRAVRERPPPRPPDGAGRGGRCAAFGAGRLHRGWTEKREAAAPGGRPHARQSLSGHRAGGPSAVGRRAHRSPPNDRGEVVHSPGSSTAR